MKVSVADQSTLADYFSHVLREELGKKLSIVERSGPEPHGPDSAPAT